MVPKPEGEAQNGLALKREFGVRKRGGPNQIGVRKRGGPSQIGVRKRGGPGTRDEDAPGPKRQLKR